MMLMAKSSRGESKMPLNAAICPKISMAPTAIHASGMVNRSFDLVITPPRQTETAAREIPLATELLIDVVLLIFAPTAPFRVTTQHH
jgi:hypothetical protein